MKVIHTQNASLPLGHYSQAIVHNGLVYVSGQLPIDPKEPERVIESVDDQTLQVLHNMQAILEAAGSDKTQVLKATVFITDLSIWARVNQVYAAFFGQHQPARSAVPVTGLPKGFCVEIDFIAACSS